MTQTDTLTSPPAPIGSVVSVTGSRAIVAMREAMPARSQNHPDRLSVGKIVLSHLDNTTAVGVVAALTVPLPDIDVPTEASHPLVEVELLGELSFDPENQQRFDRGLTAYPTIGDDFYPARAGDLRAIYQSDSDLTAEVGSLSQSIGLAATVNIKKLVTNHYAFLGATGVGKSCAVVLLLKAITERFPDFRIFIIDAHNEYRDSFGDATVTLTPSTMDLPFWLFSFEEITDIFFLGAPGTEAEIEVLREIIPIAKHRYYINQARSKPNLLRRAQDKLITFSVDTPVPYRISDLIAIIDDRCGRLERRGDVAMLRRLRSRIVAVSQDPRCAFMFGQLTIEDTMVEVLGQLFRVPHQGKPISVVELAGLPAEVVNAVVSVLCRLAFDFGLWSEGAFPILLMCEEAHRYVPAQNDRGFGPTRRAISRIAKEGRKYGLHLGIATQRPSELDPNILSQCGTVFAMRMSNDRDQEILRAAVPDALSSQLDFLPAMGPREALAIGEAVTVPMRLRFAEVPAEALPRSHSRPIDAVATATSPDFIRNVVERWRASSTHTAELADTMAPPNRIIATDEQADGQPPEPRIRRPARSEILSPVAPALAESQTGSPLWEPRLQAAPDIEGKLADAPARRRASDSPEAAAPRLDWQALRDLSRR